MYLTSFPRHLKINSEFKYQIYPPLVRSFGFLYFSYYWKEHQQHINLTNCLRSFRQYVLCKENVGFLFYLERLKLMMNFVCILFKRKLLDPLIHSREERINKSSALFVQIVYFPTESTHNLIATEHCGVLRNCTDAMGVYALKSLSSQKPITVWCSVH